MQIRGFLWEFSVTFISVIVETYRNLFPPASGSRQQWPPRGPPFSPPGQWQHTELLASWGRLGKRPPVAGERLGEECRWQSRAGKTLWHSEGAETEERRRKPHIGAGKQQKKGQGKKERTIQGEWTAGRQSKKGKVARRRKKRVGGDTDWLGAATERHPTKMTMTFLPTLQRESERHLGEHRTERAQQRKAVNQTFKLPGVSCLDCSLGPPWILMMPRQLPPNMDLGGLMQATNLLHNAETQSLFCSGKRWATRAWHMYPFPSFLSH